MSRFHHLRRLSTAAAIIAAAAVVVGGPVAVAGHTDATPNPTPTSSRQIENLGLVKNAIRSYYGDTVVNGVHQASTTSPYAKEIAGDERDLMKYLRNQKDKPHSGKPALVLDIDDTSLLTYVYDANHDFGYDFTTNNQAVFDKIFPAVFGMNEVATWATTHGYALFFVTGRGIAQQTPTIENLNEQGFPAAEHYYLKDTTASYLAPCGGSACTTIQYKSLTRQLIESQGYDIVANVGDQFSDLEGGFADRTFKLPNPMYYLP